MNAEALLPLLDMLYAAALEPSEWPNFLDALKETFQGSSAHILVENPETNFIHLFWSQGITTTATESYEKFYGRKDVWFHGSRTAPAGSVLRGHEIVPAKEFERTEFYQDWARPSGIYDSLACVFLSDDTATGRLSIGLPKTQGLAPMDQKALFEAITPHVLRAVQVDHWLSAARTKADGVLQVLAGVGTAVVITDEQGRILFVNQPAEHILQAGQGLSSTAGVLRAATHSLNNRLHALIAEAGAVGGKSGQWSGLHGTLSIPRDREPLSVLVLPLRVPTPHLGPRRPAAIVFINDPERKPIPRQPHLARLYGLTKAEARLLEALLEGDTLQDYAGRLGISINTIRTQLTHILDKTGCRGQSDLIRHVLSDQIAMISHLNLDFAEGRSSFSSAVNAIPPSSSPRGTAE